MRFDGADATANVLAAGSPSVELLFAAGGRPRRPLGLTPLIDVVFLLVIFFMLASRFGDEGKLVLDVASAAPGANAQAQAVRRIEIDAGGAVHLDGEAVAVEALERSLARGPELPVVVLPADEAPLQSIVSVLATVDAAGVTRAALAPAAAAGESAPRRGSQRQPGGGAPAGT